jgi:hypothetical protein
MRGAVALSSVCDDAHDAGHDAASHDDGPSGAYGYNANFAAGHLWLSLGRPGGVTVLTLQLLIAQSRRPLPLRGFCATAAPRAPRPARWRGPLGFLRTREGLLKLIMSAIRRR